MIYLSFTLLLSACAFLRYAEAGCSAVEECRASENCSAIPLPPNSIPSTISKKGYNVTQIRPGVYSYTDGSYFSIVIFVDGHLLLVDFPGVVSRSFQNGNYLLTEATLEILNGEAPVKVDMVFGHRHLDHIGGAGVYLSFLQSLFPNANTTVWGTSETAEALRRDSSSNIPPIDGIVGSDGATFTISSKMVMKLIVLGGHTQSDIAAHVLPSAGEDGVVHYADVVNPGVVPFLDFGITEDLFQYIAAQKKLLKLSFRVLSPGHGRLATAADVQRNIDYTEDAMAAATEAARKVTGEQLARAGAGVVENPSAPEFRNRYYALKLSFDLIVNACVEKLIDRWGCELGAVDLFAPSHCLTSHLYNLVDRQ